MSDTPRCWHIISNRWNSAITEYALSAARALEHHGSQTLFTPLAGSPAEERAQKYGLRTIPLPDFGLLSLSAVRTMAGEFKPDVVFVYGGPETFLSGFVRQVTRIRFRGSELKTGPLQAFQQRLSHLSVDRILVPGTALRASCGQVFGDEKVEQVILGCDTKKYSQSGSQSRERPELMIFGRFDPVKGHREFMEIFRRLVDRWPQAQPPPLLTIAGEAANVSASELLAAATNLGLAEEHLRILCGRFEHVATMMSEATMGVVSSLGSEQICRVAQEFLLCGTPVAVSGVGSLEDVLFKGAGMSYRGLGTEDAAALLRKGLLDAFTEPAAARRERADRSRLLFSLETMGTRLLDMIGRAKIASLTH
jgi:glycosyltransferase involved in cell wall biosynthesis